MNNSLELPPHGKKTAQNVKEQVKNYPLEDLQYRIWEKVNIEIFIDIQRTN